MEPLTTILIGAFVQAASALGAGAADTAGGDLLQAAKARLAKFAQLDDRQRAAAFDVAVRRALAAFRQSYPDDRAAERVLALLQQDEAALRQFRQIAVEELVLSAQPNLGRLLDHYRHEVRFLSLLRKQDLPPWQEIEPGLRLFFGDLLPRAIADQPMLRPLLLEQAEIQALDQVRAATHAAEDSSAALRRIEALVEELVALPKVTQSLGAEGGATISGVQQVIARNYYAAPELAKPDLARLYRRYCAFLAETYGRLNFSGILQMQQFGVLRLEDVYVPLSGRAQRQPGDRYFDTLRQRPSLPLLTAPFSVRNPTGTEPAPPLHNLVRDTALLVVLGDPGAGKSTLVRYLMLSLVEGFAGERLGLVDEWLPILLPVAAFADARAKTPDLAPMDYLSAYYTGLSQPDYGPLFRRALLGGRALVLIDGLDEVREQRREIVHCLEAFVREWDAPGNRFVATSRIAGYDEAPLDDALFLRVDTQQLDDDGIRLFAAKWSLAIEQAGTQPSERDRQVVEAEICRRADGRRLSLCSAVFANPGVTELARNPLLLTILALIHNQGTRLPDRRVELYRLCVETLAETWNRARSLSRRELDVYLGDEKLDERFVINLLGPAALWVHQENPGGLVDQRDLVANLTRTFVETYGAKKARAQGLAEDFLDLVRRHTGLLQERGHQQYGFLHLTLEEYLAARALVEVVEDTEERLRRYASAPGWREVLRLALASVSQKDAQRLLLQLLAAPAIGDVCGRPVILAGECLLDIGRNGATQRAWNAVVDRLLSLLADPQVFTALRVEGGHVLGRLGDPRLLDPRTGEAAGYGERPVPSYWCAIEAGPFWYGDDTQKNTSLQQMTLPYAFKIGRYPVTNAEYQRFIDDGGYVNDRWWTTEGWKRREGEDWVLPRFWDDAQYNNPAQPVVGISWYEAAAYCNWLTLQGHRQGWLPQDDSIRLPTSLEWERAARHTDQRRYPWGNQPPDPDMANYDATGIGQPSPVGCFPAGAAECGAMDMAGNVSEWAATPYEHSDQIEQQKDFTPNSRVWFSYSAYSDKIKTLCCGARDRDFPNSRNNYQGFRVVCSPRSSE